MNRVKSLITFIFSNFGPMIGFYFVNQFWGFKAGIIVSFFLIIAEFLWLKFKKQNINSFFYASSAMILIFGVIDLNVQEPLFFKFEATLTNLYFAILFGMSLFKDKSIVQEFAETQKRTSTEQSEDKNFFFKMFTVFWCVYFVAKAVLYLWLNFNTSLDDGLIIRIIFGKVSFWVMMFISVGIPRQIWKILEKFKLFPSQRLIKSPASKTNL